MASELIQDRGRGPEIVGTRITVFNLLPHFLDATATEAYICRLYGITPEEVAAARAYVLNNPETVLDEHLRIEARIAAGNPREVIEQAKQTRAAFLTFKQWLAQREKAAGQEQQADSRSASVTSHAGPFPTFREWLAEQETRSAEVAAPGNR
jgi:uncharacterized protein (DUF433 family)